MGTIYNIPNYEDPDSTTSVMGSKRVFFVAQIINHHFPLMAHQQDLISCGVIVGGGGGYLKFPFFSDVR